MYGMKQSTGLASAGIFAGAMDAWMIFAAITVMFAFTAVWQLSRRANEHRP
jgi:hypothetical protein